MGCSDPRQGGGTHISILGLPKIVKWVQGCVVTGRSFTSVAKLVIKSSSTKAGTFNQQSACAALQRSIMISYGAPAFDEVGVLLIPRDGSVFPYRYEGLDNTKWRRQQASSAW